MPKQTISTGTIANDGTGDTLRAAAQKINSNFDEIYAYLGGDSNTLSSNVFIQDSSVVFEGLSVDAYETRLSVVDPTADRFIKLPDVSGEVIIDGATQTLTNKTVNSSSLNSPKIITAVLDSNGNEFIKLIPAASAVNEITLYNSATGNPPIISATGGDTNINLRIESKGTGSVRLSKVALSQVEVTSDGSVNTSYSYIMCNKSSALALSLANGTTNGEMKVFTNKGTGIATITPASFANGTSVALDQNDSVTLIWGGSFWYITGQYGATVA